MTSYAIFIMSWILGSSAVIGSYVEAKSKKKVVAWLSFACVLLAFILPPVERFYSEAEADIERKGLQDKIQRAEKLIATQETAIKVLDEKNIALEKHIVLLTAVNKIVTRMAISIEATYWVDGVYNQLNGVPISLINAPFAMIHDLYHKVPNILFHSQNMQYELMALRYDNNGTTFKYTANAEVFNSTYPIGKTVEELKNHNMVTFFIPFRLQALGPTVDNRKAKILRLEAYLIVNGRKVMKPFEISNKDTGLSIGYYEEPNSWIQAVVWAHPSSIYDRIDLKKFK